VFATTLCRAASAKRALGLAFAIVPASLAVSVEARAEEDARARARRHFARGVEIANEGAYAEAIVEFGRAYELSPHYSVLYNIAQAYVALGRPVEAVDMFARYLAEGGVNVSAERQRAVESEMQKQRSRIAELEITTDVPNAAIWIDGSWAGRTPLARPARVGIGRHRIVAEAESGARAERIVQVAGEERAPVTLRLAAPSAPRPVPAREPAGKLEIGCAQAGLRVWIDERRLGTTPLGAPLAVAPGAHRVRFVGPDGLASEQRVVVTANALGRAECGRAPLPADPERREREHAQRSYGYVLGGLGLALGGAALGHFLWNKGRYDDWRARHDELSERPDREAQGDNNTLARSIDRASIVTVGLAVGAGAAFGTGALLVLTVPREEVQKQGNAARAWRLAVTCAW
jgi:hypothetical protein